MCSSAISPLVRNSISAGTTGAFAPRIIARPVLRQIQLIATGRLPRSLAIERLTATWQLSVLPSRPQYWRATPTECVPFFAYPVSSMIQWHAASFLYQPRQHLRGHRR